MKHFLNSKRARGAATSSAQGSATVTGGTPSGSTANSAGASTNLVEISETLDPLLNALNEDERLSITEENIASRLRQVCEAYPQSQVPESLSQWTCNQHTLDLVCLAASCSEAVYKRKTKTQVAGITHLDATSRDIRDVSASLDGTTKATLITLQSDSRTLVVAFRGTKATSPIDWITNANGNTENAADFLPDAPNSVAHSGFLYVARNMAGDIRSAILACSEPVDHVLFTGHSAGGAIASLIFAHFKMSGTLGELRLDCISFGAPPVMFPGEVIAHLHTSGSTFLAFVNHGDPVALADKPYIKLLLNVYSRPSPLPYLDFEASELCNAGTVLLIYDQNPDKDDDNIGVSEVTNNMSNLLFGNVKVHPMRHYLTLIGAWKSAQIQLAS